LKIFKKLKKERLKLKKNLNQNLSKLLKIWNKSNKISRILK